MEKQSRPGGHRPVAMSGRAGENAEQTDIARITAARDVSTTAVNVLTAAVTGTTAATTILTAVKEFGRHFTIPNSTPTSSAGIPADLVVLHGRRADDALEKAGADERCAVLFDARQVRKNIDYRTWWSMWGCLCGLPGLCCYMCGQEPFLCTEVPLVVSFQIIAVAHPDGIVRHYIKGLTVGKGSGAAKSGAWVRVGLEVNVEEHVEDFATGEHHMLISVTMSESIFGFDYAETSTFEVTNRGAIHQFEGAFEGTSEKAAVFDDDAGPLALRQSGSGINLAVQLGSPLSSKGARRRSRSPSPSSQTGSGGDSQPAGERIGEGDGDNHEKKHQL